MRRMIRHAITMVLVAIVFGRGRAGGGNQVRRRGQHRHGDADQGAVRIAGEVRRQDLRVDGIVTAVCTEMGCWLALGAADNPDQAVRFQADHDGKIVFPITLKGKQASAEGVFIKIAAGDKEAKEAAGEHAASQPKAADFGRRYQFQVTGAVAP